MDILAPGVLNVTVLIKLLPLGHSFIQDTYKNIMQCTTTSHAIITHSHGISVVRYTGMAAISIAVQYTP